MIVSQVDIGTSLANLFLPGNFRSRAITLGLEAAGKPPLHGLYRFHIPDPIRFEKNILVMVQDIGHNGQELFERSDEISSVAYWYQTPPHRAFPALPAAQERWPLW